MKRVFLAVLIIASASLGALAQNFEAGLSAFDNEQYDIAIQEWRPLANIGNLPAQYNMGIIYENGLGVRQSYAEAVDWYREAAQNGDVWSQTRLGILTFEGLGRPQNYLEAIELLTASAQAGHDEAQVYLGDIYFDGLGVPRNLDFAIGLYRLAWAQGRREAFERLEGARADQRVELGFENQEDLYQRELSAVVGRLTVGAANLFLNILETQNCNRRLGPSNEFWPMDIIYLYLGKSFGEMEALAGLYARMSCR